MNDERLVDWFRPLDPEASEQGEIFAACLARVDGKRPGADTENLPRGNRPEVCGPEETQEISENTGLVDLAESTKTGEIGLGRRSRLLGGRIEIKSLRGVRNFGRSARLDSEKFDRKRKERSRRVIGFQVERSVVLPPDGLIFLVDDGAVVLLVSNTCQNLIDTLVNRLERFVGTMPRKGVQQFFRKRLRNQGSPQSGWFARRPAAGKPPKRLSIRQVSALCDGPSPNS